MLGDVLSNQSVALSGGLAVAASVNASAEHAAANAGHGSAPDIAGKGIANPAGIILSTAMLLRWLGTKRSNNACIAAADAIETAVDATLAAGRMTGDLGGTLSTMAFAKEQIGRAHV